MQILLCSCQTPAFGYETKKYILINFSLKLTCHLFKVFWNLGNAERVLPVVMNSASFCPQKSPVIGRGQWNLGNDKSPSLCIDSASFPSPKSSPRCPVIGRGQTMKVQVPAVVVQMPIRGIRLHLNLKSKKNENPLPPSRRRTPNYPAKLLLSYLLVQKGKGESETSCSIFAECLESEYLCCTSQAEGFFF